MAATRHPPAQGWLHFMATASNQWYTHRNDVRTPIHYAPPVVYEINATYSAANVIKTQEAIEWYRNYRRPTETGKVDGVGEHFKYYSGRDCVDNNPRYAVEVQINRADLEGDIPGSILATAWGGDPNRFYIDIRQSAVQDWMAEYFVEQTVSGGYKVLTLDNITRAQSYGPIASAEVTQADYEQGFMDLLEKTYDACRAVGIKLGINLATGSTIGIHWPLFYDRCDVFSYEQPMHELVTLNNSADVADEIDAYADALDNGKAILLFPSVEGVVSRVTKQRIVACAVMFAKRRMGQPAYVWGVDSAGNGTPENFDWFLWPYRFGEPEGPYVRSGDVFSREFQKGTLTLDLTTYTSPVITATFEETHVRPTEKHPREMAREVRKIARELSVTDPLNAKLGNPKTRAGVRRELQRAKDDLGIVYPAGSQRSQSIRRNLQRIDREAF